MNTEQGSDPPNAGPGTFKLYNTLTREKEEFEPIDGDTVRMYVCGPTVYKPQHIGNFRTFLSVDLLRRYLKYKGYSVEETMNLTDVDDKTIRESRERGVTLREHTDEQIQIFLEGLRLLNIEEVEHRPRATDEIDGMVELVEKLIDEGLAYEADDGSVYYSISRFPDYGKLSGVDTSELKEGARVDSQEYTKENVKDFVLWKAWTEEDGDVSWSTPIGKGRPGWHIECSVMSTKYLGQPLDIHAGGEDLVFPHHENEIAQSEGAHGEQFSRFWFHVKHLWVEGEKMSKSKGNIYTPQELVEEGHSPRAMRYLLLSAHYRDRLNFTFDGLDAAVESLDRLDELIYKSATYTGEGETPAVGDAVEEMRSGFEEAMDNDLNTPEALASVFGFVRTINGMDQSELTEKDGERIREALFEIDNVLGLGLEDLEYETRRDNELLAERAQLRQVKNFDEADALRSQIEDDTGGIVEDFSTGSVIKLPTHQEKRELP